MKLVQTNGLTSKDMAIVVSLAKRANTIQLKAMSTRIKTESAGRK